MASEKDFRYVVLMDIYSGMLTEKQALALDYYYNSDYSLAEIAELMDITRQGVRDFIKRGEMILDDADKKLGLYDRFRRLDAIRGCAAKILEDENSTNEINILAEQIIKEADCIQNGEK